ncbi:MFS transporter [Celerinatantimonas sp. YJH-8]|uniref:MFS transporter n=1 Tax=Celerinatantimonas sp. YJH-8 TaxID=3228714 RepID=UPI0038C4D211
MQKNKSKNSRLPVLIYWLTIGTFLMGTSEFIVAGLLPEISMDYHISTSQAGLAVTLFAIGMIIGAPLVALLSLHISKRTTLILSLCIFAIGHMLAALTTHFDIMLISRVISAIATGGFWGAAAVVATQAAGASSSARAMGLVIGGGMLANVLGVPLGSFIGQLSGWRLSFWALAIIPIFLAFVIFKAIPKPKEVQKESNLAQEFKGLLSARLWLVLAACVTINAGVLSVYSFISPLLIEHTHLSNQYIPLALGLFGMASLIGTIYGGRLGDKHPYSLPIVTAALSMLACFGLLLFSTLPIPTLILFTVLGAVGLTANPLLTSQAVKYAGQSPTLSSSMVISLLNVGTALGTWLSTLMMNTTLGIMAPVYIGVLFSMMTVCPVFILAIVEKYRPRGTIPYSHTNDIV